MNRQLRFGLVTIGWLVADCFHRIIPGPFEVVCYALTVWFFFFRETKGNENDTQS
jgi:hypothetical protein